MKIAALIAQHPANQALIDSLQSVEDSYVSILTNISDSESISAFMDRLPGYSPDVVMVDASSWACIGINTSIRQQCPNHTALVLFLDDANHQSAAQLFADFDIDSVISPPFTVPQLLIQLEAALNQRKAMLKMNSQIEAANSTAMTAITTVSELGQLVQMFEAMECAGNYDSIVECVFNVCSSLDFRAVMQIVDHDDQFFYPAHAVTDSLRAILTSAGMADIRIVSQKRLMLMRTDHFVLLITNSPWEDEARSGRMRDLLIQVATIVDAKIRSVMVNRLIDRQHGKVMAIMNMLRKLTMDTQDNTRVIMRQLSEDLEISALTLDLNEQQENHLLKLSEKALNSLESLYNTNDVIEAHFHQLISSFTQIKALTAERSNSQNSQSTHNSSVDLF